VDQLLVSLADYTQSNRFEGNYKQRLIELNGQINQYLDKYFEELK